MQVNEYNRSLSNRETDFQGSLSRKKDKLSAFEVAHKNGTNKKRTVRTIVNLLLCLSLNAALNCLKFTFRNSLHVS